MSLPLIPRIMKHHGHDQSSESDRPQPNRASHPFQATSNLFTAPLKALIRDRDRGSSSAPQPAPSPVQAAQPSASEKKSPTPSPAPTPTPTPTSTPIQPLAHDAPKPPRARVPAVTSKAMTTAPMKDKSRPHRRKYPTNMRQRH